LICECLDVAFMNALFLPSANAKLVRFIRDGSGQGMVEYILVLVLIAVALVGFFSPIATEIARLMNSIVAALKT
jgi:Flp pilus assembly pilin Flp